MIFESHPNLTCFKRKCTFQSFRLVPKLALKLKKSGLTIRIEERACMYIERMDCTSPMLNNIFDGSQGQQGVACDFFSMQHTSLRTNTYLFQMSKN